MCIRDSLKSLFTSARMSIIEATCATTSPELKKKSFFGKKKEGGDGKELV